MNKYWGPGLITKLNTEVWHAHNCSVYYLVISNYQMSNKDLACLIPLSICPPLGSPDCVTSDFARYSVIVPMGLILPTFFAENGFSQPMIGFLPYYSWFSSCRGTIKQTYLRTEEERRAHMGVLVSIISTNYLESSSSCCADTKAAQESSNEVCWEIVGWRWGESKLSQRQSAQ